MNKKKLNPT